jgi:anti-sigma B factor antagonist
MTAKNTPGPASDFFSGTQSPSQRNGIEPLRVAVLAHDQAIVVAHVAGEIDMRTGPALQSHLDTALATRPARLIIDLSQVSFRGATALAVLINAKTVANHQSTTVQLRGLSRAAARVLHAAGLTHLFDISGRPS